MIRLFNGHEFDFACASGALAFDGRGWWWEKPLRLLGIIDPTKFTVITKTLTLKPLKGNLKMWCPWRCVSLIPGGATNAVGLTNPGLGYWWVRYYSWLKYDTILSVMPKEISEVGQMSGIINMATKLKGVQINASCPNVARNQSVKLICEIVLAAIKKWNHPIILKLSYADDYVRICKELDGLVSAFELINTVPFHMVFPGKESPLQKYNLTGGVSGKPISSYALEALQKVKAAGVKTPIISGGGIMNLEDVLLRQKEGADAFVLGTVFLRTPWRPNKIMSSYRNKLKSNS